jgi:putative flavoprotein involved in K+ transport
MAERTSRRADSQFVKLQARTERAVADVVIVGGGQSGLAAAYVASRARLRPVVLEAAAEPVGSWPHYHDSLRLFSPARFSALPGRSFAGDGERYPTRDEVVDYLRGYAATLDADVRCGQRVDTVERDEEGRLIARTAAGLEVQAAMVIAATGGFRRPHRPALAGVERFTGAVLHSSQYRAPEQFAGQRVVVVGAGDSAVQIAADMASVARVSLATRKPLRWQPQRPLGRDMHWWLIRSGLDTASIGRWLDRGTRVVDDGRYHAALRSGNPDRRPMFTGLEGDAVRWSDGTLEPVDAVIFATGYRPGLDYVAAIGALDGDDLPLHRRGISTAVPGLGYVGLPHQRSIASATLRGSGPDAEHVISRLRIAAATVRERRRSAVADLPLRPAPNQSRS